MSYFYTNNRFNRGEIDPSLHGRQDLDFYLGACKKMENWFPEATGGIKRRPYFDSVKYWEHLLPEQSKSRPFQFRFAGMDFLIVLTYAGVSSSLVVFSFIIENGEATSLGSDVLVGSSDIDIFQGVHMAAFGPAVFITSHSFAPRRFFVAKNGGSWDANLEEISWYEEVLGTVAVEGGSTEVSGTDTLFEEQFSVGDQLRIKDSWYEVDEITDQTTLQLTAAYSGLTLSDIRVQKETADPFGSGEHPALCTFFQSRLILFSTESRPVTMWASKTQAPFTIVAGSVYDDAPIEFDLLVENVDAFRWVYTLDRIYLGGSQGEFSVGASDTVLTPTSVEFGRISSLGGASISPTSAESSIIFASYTRRSLFSVQFDLQRQGFVSTNITQLASHLFGSPIRDMAYRPPVVNDQSPRIFIVLEDGSIRVCTIIESEDVLAWHRIDPPPAFTFTGVAASSSNAWFTAYADIGGTGYISLFALNYPQPTYDFCLDLQQEHPITGDNKLEVLPDYFEGTIITVIDPEIGWIGDFLVENNEVTLPEGLDYQDDVVIGWLYNSEIELLPAGWDTQQGMMLSRKRRMIRAIVNVQQTHSLFVGGFPLLPGVPSPEPTYRTGIFEVRFLGWTTQDYLKLETSSPYPAVVSSVTREVNV